MVDAQRQPRQGGHRGLQTRCTGCSAPSQLTSWRCPWSGRWVHKHRELPQVERRCSRRSHGPQFQPSPLAAEPNPASAKQQLLFQLGWGNQQEKETQRAGRPHILRSPGTTSVPTPLIHACPSPSPRGQAESPHLSTALLPHCCPLLPCPQESTHGNTWLHALAA